MKYRFLNIFAILGCLTMSSCSKFLEEQSQSEVIPKTAIDYRELLMGSGYLGQTEPTSFLYFMDDDVDLFLEYADGNASIVGSDDAVRNFLYYTWQPRLADVDGLGNITGEDPASTAYYAFYEKIMGCNAVLDNINSSIGTEDEKNRVKAEALAMRSFYYFRLVNLYGMPYNSDPTAPGVPLKLNSGIDNLPMKRNTVKEVYDVIVRDLNLAADLMDPLPIARRDYHINQPAIHILLSRVYLYMERWEDCIKEADKVFQQGGVITDMTGYTTGYWITYTNPEVEWMFGGNPQANQSTYIPSADFRGTFDPQDVRLNYGFSILPQTFTPLVTKYTQSDELSQGIRSSEALLNRAEAYVQVDELEKAMTDLNQLRSHRIIGYSNESISEKNTLLQAVRDERRKEFCYEGFRWFDLRRYGMPSISHRYQHQLGEAVLHYVLKAKDPMYVLPFPNSLILRNTELEQNPSANIPERIGE